MSNDVPAEKSGLVRAYSSFPLFAEWKACSVSVEDWARASRDLETPSSYEKGVLDTAFRIVRRAAAVDTGALENLYPGNRGFTFTIAAEAYLWQAALEQQSPDVRSLIQAQLAAYEVLVDLATGAVPVTEVLIRRLHEEVCAGQGTYRVLTAVGPQDHEFQLGAYKTDPNNVMTAGGTIFNYCPPESVAPEMQRLVTELSSDQFAKAHPVVQAAYSHYAFVLIHPFADGNGRVARLLASLYLCRAKSIPLLVLADQREEYLSAIREADSGSYQPLVDFFLHCCAMAFALARQSLDAAALPAPENALGNLAALFKTRGGFALNEVDRAAERLLQALSAELTRHLGEMPKSEHISRHAVGRQSGALLRKPPEGYRPTLPLSHIVLRLETPKPWARTVYILVAAEVPKDASQEDSIKLCWEAISPNPKAPHEPPGEPNPTPTQTTNIAQSHASQRAAAVAAAQKKPPAVPPIRSGVTELTDIPIRDLVPDLRPSVSMRCFLAGETLVRLALVKLTESVAARRREVIDGGKSI